MADLPPHDEATEESEEVVTDFTNNDSLIANEVVLKEEFREKINETGNSWNDITEGIDELELSAGELQYTMINDSAVVGDETVTYFDEIDDNEVLDSGNTTGTIEVIDNGTILMDAPCKSSAQRVRKHRLKFKIDNLLDEREEKDKMVTEAELMFNDALVTEVQRLIRNWRRIESESKSKSKTNEFLLQLFPVQFENANFRQWFIKKFHLYGEEKLYLILQFEKKTCTDHRLLSKAIRQDVSILKENVNVQSADLEDIEINLENPKQSAPNVSM